MVEKFELIRTPVLVPQIFCQILSLLHIWLCILKLWCVWLTQIKRKRLTQFWRPPLRGTPIVVLPYFVKFYLFIFVYSGNFISPGWAVQFWILASLLEGDPFILVLPNFVKFYLIFVFAYPKNFMCLARVVKKLEFWRPCLRGTPILIYPNFVKFYLFFISANPKNYMCLACVIRKLDIWQPHLRGTPILVPQIVLKSMCLLYLLTLKTSCVQL